MNPITPTSAIVVGGLSPTGFGYNKYLKSTAPHIGITIVIVSTFLAIGTVVG